jgi:diadenosine tetraphosphate (Ap4A) HIT family hydrolase
MIIYENEYIFIKVHESKIPWLKIFTKREIKEFSQCNKDEKDNIFMALDIIEKKLLEFYSPAKINIAQFGNYLPHLHWHIMARFDDDEYFPEPMWGKKQREALDKKANFEQFLQILKGSF